MDLKNYRAPRPSPWLWILGIAGAVAAGGIVGPMDYADRLATQADNRELRVELAKLQRPQSRAEPERPGCRNPKKQQYHMHQADGGRWKGGCRDGLLKVNHKGTP